MTCSVCRHPLHRVPRARIHSGPLRAPGVVSADGRISRHLHCVGRSQRLADRLRKAKAGRMGHHCGRGPHSAQTRVGYKELRKRALQDHHTDALIGLEFPAECVEFLRRTSSRILIGG